MTFIRIHPEEQRWTVKIRQNYTPFSLYTKMSLGENNLILCSTGRWHNKQGSVGRDNKHNNFEFKSR